VRIQARDEASASLEGNVTPRLIEGDRVDERLSFFVVALKYRPPMVPIAGCYAEIGGWILQPARRFSNVVMMASGSIRSRNSMLTCRALTSPSHPTMNFAAIGRK